VRRTGRVSELPYRVVYIYMYIYIYIRDGPNASVGQILRPKPKLRFGSVRFGELCDSAEASAECSVLFGVGNISFVFTVYVL
jgi:hypothetical protein